MSIAIVAQAAEIASASRWGMMPSAASACASAASKNSIARTNDCGLKAASNEGRARVRPARLEAMGLEREEDGFAFALQAHVPAVLVAACRLRDQRCQPRRTGDGREVRIGTRGVLREIHAGLERLQEPAGEDGDVDRG